MGGAYAGYNYQVSPNFVVGLEGDFQGNHSSTSFYYPTFDVTASVQQNWLASLNGRLGIAYDRALFYAIGGAAWGQGSVTVTPGILLFPPSLPPVSRTANLSGWDVGAGVEDRAVGDRVVALSAAGSHAARRAVPAAITWPIPDGLDAARAACVPVAFGTAYECVFTAGNLTEGQTVLIHAGAGGVGMAAIQLAKRAGATVIATASSDEKLERLKATAKLQNVSLDDICAIGDGANDLPMIMAAGLGIAFHGKPVVAEKATHNIRFGTLRGVLWAQGYRKEDLV